MLEEKDIGPTLPNGYQWREASFDTLSDLNPNAAFCLVIGSHYSDYGWIRYSQGGTPMTPNTHWMYTNDGGNLWSSPNNTQDMRFYIYGTVTTLGAPQWP